MFIVDGRFTFAPQDDARTLIDGGYLLPGLVDAHAHLAIGSPAGDAPPAQRVVASAKAHLQAGVLVVREPGGPDRSSIGLGPDRGLPRVVAGGQFLAPPGGYFPGLARFVDDRGLPDAAVEEYRASGAWAKVIGDFFNDESRLVPNFRRESLVEAARRVHDAGGRIAIHAMTAPAIEDAIEAGFDSIEHGTFLQPDHIAAMAKRRIAYTPTMNIAEGILGFVSSRGITNDDFEQVRLALERQPERVRQADAAGLLVLAGTDAGMGPHGMIRVELRHLLDAGLAPNTALGAASWTARRYLGLPGIEEGAPADLVAYRDDPRDPEVLTRPAAIVLDGREVSAGRPR